MTEPDVPVTHSGPPLSVRRLQREGVLAPGSSGPSHPTVVQLLPLRLWPFGFRGPSVGRRCLMSLEFKLSL